MTETAAPGRRGCPSWMKLLLILSLAANVGILGLVIGHSFRPDEESGRGPNRTVDWIVAMVPEERRDLAIAHFAEARDRMAAAADERSENLAEVVAAMRAEPFDAARLEAALAALFDNPSSGRRIVRERLITLVAQLTPAEREVFAQRFGERLGSDQKRRD